MADEQETCGEDREKLFRIVYGILLEMIDFDDDILGMAADRIVDAVIEHADDIQKIAADANANDKPESDEE